MLLIEDKLVSLDVIEEQFVCDLLKCKGACCIEGDLGAPLEDKELELIVNEFENFKEYLRPEGLAVIKKEGAYIKDVELENSTPTIEGRECVYAVYDEKGVLKCGIEQAYRDGKTSFRKPSSCFMYPIRLSKVSEYVALNYDRWEICSDACSNGQELKVKVYEFLKVPLIEEFGEKWYNQLVEVAEEYLKSK